MNSINCLGCAVNPVMLCVSTEAITSFFPILQPFLSHFSVLGPLVNVE